MTAVSVAVLGPLHVTVHGNPVQVSGTKQAAVLSVLALEAPRAVSADTIIENVWADDRGERAEHTLQQHVSSLRKLLEPERGPRQESSVIVTQRQSYLLHAEVDLADFDARAASGDAAHAAGLLAESRVTYDQALALWRGPALADLRISPWMEAVAARLEEKRSRVCESRIDVMLAEGRHGDLVVELEGLVREHPFRERMWEQLMLALYRSGRQAEALAAFGRARTALVEELGIEPGPDLRSLERRILDQDPALDDLGVLDPGAASSIEDLHETYRTGSPGAAGLVRRPDGQMVQLAEGANLIGRSPNAEVHLSDSRVSRSHAVIEVAAGVATVRDLGSTNGTTLDGAELGEQVLRDGQVISVGGVELLYQG